MESMLIEVTLEKFPVAHIVVQDCYFLKAFFHVAISLATLVAASFLSEDSFKETGEGVRLNHK
jgi:hypothetical protein